MTISAASQASIAVSSARIKVAVSATNARRPRSAATPKAPAPMPRRFALIDISAFASSTSLRAREVA